jgi:hypothetical protein
MRRVVNCNPVSNNADGALAFSVICSYVLKVAQLAFCLSVTGKNSFFCATDPDPERILLDLNPYPYSEYGYESGSRC